MKYILAIILLVAGLSVTMMAQAQVPATLTLSRGAGAADPVLGQLPMVTTVRPAGTTTQRATFMFRTTGYFYNPTTKWKATGYHLATIMRMPADLTGRGIIIGNVHGAAEFDPAFCRFPATVQAETFGNSGYVGALYPSTCLNDRERLRDDRWYRVTIRVNDAMQIIYTLQETTALGVAERTIASNVTITASHVGAPPINAMGFSIVSTDASGDPTYARPAFTIEIKNLSVVWE